MKPSQLKKGDLVKINYYNLMGTGVFMRKAPVGIFKEERVVVYVISFGFSSAVGTFSIFSKGSIKKLDE